MKGLTTTASMLVTVGTSNTFSIQGTVSTTLGAPMQGVVVSASPTQSATTDGDGAYSITGLAAGSYTLTATKTGASFVTSGFTNPVTVGPSQVGKNFLAPPGAPVFTAALKPGLTDQGASTGAIPLPLADADTAISLLTLTGTSSNQAIIPDASIIFNTGTTRTITASAASTVSGSVDITITATDPEGNTGNYLWPVTVNAKPVLATSTPTTAENTLVDIDLRAFVTDDITPDESLFFEVDRVRNGKMTMLPDGYTARFTPNPNFNGTTNYRLVVRDQSLGSGFRFLYDFEPPDIAEDSLSTDQSNFNRTGTLQAINGATYAYDASVPPALSPQSANALVLTQNGGSGARLRRTLTTADHNLNDADWTLSAWVKRGGTDTEDFVFHLGDGDGHGTESELELFFAADSDVLKLQKWGSGGLEKEIVCSDIPSGQWHHITLIYDRIATNTGTLSLYVGRFLRGSVDTVTMNLSQAAPVVAGGHNSTTASVDRWLDGVMDEVLFQSGLSARSEIFNRSRMGARHHHGLSAIGNNLAITVTGSNQPPSIVTVPDRYIPVNASASPVTVRLSDAETEARILTLTASSSNQTLIPNASITVGAAPAAWTSTDIGSVTTAGSLTESRGTYLVNGAGATGIGPAVGDAFRWVRQSFTGDAEMIARVVSVDHTASNAEAGLMIRESTAATSRFVCVRVTGSEGVSFVQRSTASTDAVVTATLPLASSPCWLRLVRSGSIYTAFYATDNDGTAGPWQAVGTEQTVTFTGTTHDIGMAVSSRVDATLCTATFDSLGGTVLRGGERTVSLTPAAGQSGSATITLTANDGALTGNTSFTVIVDGAAPSTTVWNATSTSGTLNWSTGSNWTGGITPPSSRFTTVQFFTDQTLPAGTITSNNDSVGGHALNVLTLGGTGPTSGASTLSLSGNALLLRRESLLDPIINLTTTNGTGLTWNVSAPLTMEDSTTFQGAGTATFNISGILSGAGNLIKAGTSKLILSGANTYTGTTTISGGILQIGDDGASGSLPAGAVVNNATLRFDRTGTLLVPNAISGSGAVTIDCPINAGTVVLDGSNSFTGNVTQKLTGVVQTLSTVTADRAQYSATNKLSSSLAGTATKPYTVIFPGKTQTPAKDSKTYPQGDGFATMTVNVNGTVSLTGKLADHTPITASAPLSKLNLWPVFAQLYNLKGSIAGMAALSDASASNEDVAGTNLLWFRPDPVPLVEVQWYKHGWPGGITVDLNGARYVIPPTMPLPTPSVFPGLGAVNAGTGNATLTLTGGLLNPGTLSSNINIALTNVVTNAPVPATPALLAASPTMLITRASGLFTGTFTHTDLTKPAFQGVIIQKGSKKGGSGYFMSRPTPLNGLGESGKVQVLAK
jgi:autotransporter-associated beta strand protein